MKIQSPINIFNSIINWVKIKYQESEKRRDAKMNSFSADIAFSRYAIKRDISFDELYKALRNSIIDRIKYRSINKYTELYVYYSFDIAEEHRKMLINDLEKLGYRILYNSKTSIIISWGK